MKPAVLVLAGSLAANVGLFSMFAWEPALAPPAFRDFFRRNFQSTTSVAGSLAAAPPVAPPKPKLWSVLATDDLATLVNRLRAAGFPPDVIRSIVRVRLDARFDPRIQALVDPDPNTPFWKLPSRGRASSQRWEQISQLQRERSRLERALLSDDFFATSEISADQRRRFGDLPRAKVDALQRIEDDYAELKSSINAAMKGITLPSDREQLALLQREKAADLAALLTPAELADYEMRSSPITRMLGRRLGDFDASEAEFHAIFQMQQAFGQKYSDAGGDYQEQQRMFDQLNDQLKATLGDARYADYTRETSYEYRQLQTIAERDHLPADAAQQAFALREHTAQQSGVIYDDPALSAEQKGAALKALAQETRTQLLATLGPEAGATYLKMADRWLNRVEQGAAVNFSGMSTTMADDSVMAVGGGPTFRRLPRPKHG